MEALTTTQDAVPVLLLVLPPAIAPADMVAAVVATGLPTVVELRFSHPLTAIIMSWNGDNFILAPGIVLSAAMVILLLLNIYTPNLQHPPTTRHGELLPVLIDAAEGFHMSAAFDIVSRWKSKVAIAASAAIKAAEHVFLNVLALIQSATRELASGCAASSKNWR